MWTFMQTYPYFVWTLCWMFMLGGLLTLCSPFQRRLALASALISTPFAFTEALAIPHYWNPARTANWLGASPEDFLFCIATGGICWLLASHPFRGRLVSATDPRLIFKRGLQGLSLGVMVFGGSFFLPFKPMTNLLMPILATGILALCMRPRLWKISLAGMIGFTSIYLAFIKACFVLMPGFFISWTPENLWGPAVWGIPLDEIAWAAAFGAIWPLAMAYALDIRMMEPGRESTAELSRVALGTSDDSESV